MQYLDSIIQALEADPPILKRLCLRVLKYALERRIPQEQHHDIPEWWPTYNEVVR